MCSSLICSTRTVRLEKQYVPRTVASSLRVKRLESLKAMGWSIAPPSCGTLVD